MLSRAPQLRRLSALPQSHIRYICSNIGESPPINPPKPTEVDIEAEDAGRTLAKLALMVRGAKGAIQTAARERSLIPETQVEVEQEIAESQQLISRALKAAGIEDMKVDDLGEHVSESIIPIPREALSYKLLLRAEFLRDSFESHMVALNVMPPRAAWVDGSGKPFCRLAKRRAAEAANALEEASADENGAASIALPASEVLKRKSQLEAANELKAALQGFDTCLLEVKRVHKVHKGGTTLSMRALVIIGNRAGTAGYGEGKSETVAHAVERACRDATRNLLTIQRKNDRTIYHRVQGKYVKSKVSLWPAPPGTGISANNNFSAIFQLFGIRDVGAKLHGPRSLTNAVKALFNALSRVHTPESIAFARGLPLAEVTHVPRLGVVQRISA